MSFKTLLLGDVVGKPGRLAIDNLLKDLVESEGIDLVVANCENAAAGSGITPSIYRQLRLAGVDVLTMGDHCFRKKESLPLYDAEDRLLRPANLPDVAAGHGWTIVETAAGHLAAVVNLQGRTFLKPIDCPFAAIDRALEQIDGRTPLVFIDLHAEATSDKIAMGWHLDGKVTALVGTHTHVQTADQRILPQGTAYITDLGMTGPYDGVLGRDKGRVLRHLTTAMPSYFLVSSGDIHLCGVIVTADPQTGRASQIRQVNIPFAAMPEQGDNEAGPDNAARQ
ncbi:MAG: TIGR00282 family metallophosphoesterase [Anaerolineaceae bacterium]|nr:TIGR00282 family metallophosphoesterase [Anaerolineaceae bacterium]